MTDSDEASPAHNESAAETEQVAANVQTLTDLFDQLDRDSFKRALANRDAFGANYWQRKSQGR